MTTLPFKLSVQKAEIFIGQCEGDGLCLACFQMNALEVAKLLIRTGD